MTIDISAENPRIQYTVTSADATFDYLFEIFQDSDIAVYVGSTKKQLTVDYTVSGANTTGGGTVTLNNAVSNTTVTLVRDIEIKRTTDFPASGAFQVGSLNTELDTITAVQQTLEDKITRSLRLADEDGTVAMTLPLKADRVGKILGFNSSTGVPESYVYLTNENTVALDGLTAGTVTASKYVLVDANKDIGTFRNVTLSGALTSATLDISGNADIDGILEADAITIEGTALDEYIADTVGAMVGSNTETGITVTYEDGDNTLDFALGASQTTITSLLATDIKIGEDDQTKIDFETADTIHFYAGNENQLILTDGALTPASNAIVDLGTDALEFKDAYFDGTVEADAYTVEGVALNEYIADTVGAMVGSNTETGISVTYDDADNTLDFVIGTDSITGTMLNDDIISGQTAITSGLASTDELLFSDAGTIKRMDVSVLTDYYKGLEVTETNKTLTSPKINEDVALTSTATELNLLDNVSGLVKADFTKLAEVDSTSTELNIVDGNTSVGTTAVASGDGIVTNDGGTMRQTNVDTFDTYLSQTTKTLTNKTLTNPTLTSPVLNTGVSGTAILDEDDMSTDSATQLATQQSIKAYVDAQKADMQFVLEDGDGTEVQITKDKEVKFVEGGGIDINWTDISTGSDGDPFDLTFTINADQTDITSLLATDIKIGEDDQTKIDFETNNQINFYADNTKRVTIDSTGLTVNSGSLETATIDYTDGDLAMTIADGGAVTFAQVPVFPDDTIETNDIQDNAVTLAKMAGLDRGKLITGDSSGDPSALAIGTNGQYLKSDGNDLVWGSATVSGLACDDLTTGDSAVTIATSSGDITIDAQANNSDIIFKGTDGGSDITALTLDMSANGNASFNNNVNLQSDSSVINFGADKEISLTHVHDTGLLLNSTSQLQFGDSGTYIHQSADGVLDLVSDTEIELNATTIEMNGNVTGTTMTHLVTLTADNDTDITFSSTYITDTYMDYKIIIRFYAPANNGQTLFVSPSGDNGSNYNILIEEHMQYHDMKAGQAFGMASTANNLQKIQLGAGTSNQTDEGMSAELMFIGLRQTTGFKMMHFNCLGAHDNDTGHGNITADGGGGGNDYWWNGGAKIIGTSDSNRVAINNLKFTAGSGNIKQGTFSLYGIKS